MRSRIALAILLALSSAASAHDQTIKTNDDLIARADATLREGNANEAVRLYEAAAAQG